MMRIAISGDDQNGLDSVVSPHFGRCPHYILVDVDGDEVKAVKLLSGGRDLLTLGGHSFTLFPFETAAPM